MQLRLLAALLLPVAALRGSSGSGSVSELRRTAAFLSVGARELESPEMTMLAQQFSDAVRAPGAIDGVKNMLRDMLAKKMDEHAQSTTHADFCKTEMVSSKSKVKQLQDRLEKYHADQDMMEATIAEMKEKVADKTDEVSKHAKAVAKGTEAMQGLENKNKELQQLEQTSGLPLAKIQERDANSRELFHLKNTLQDLEVGSKKAQKDAEYERRNIVSKNLALSNLKRDVSDYQQQLAASTDYARQIAHQCTVPAESAKERQSRRHAEIGRLKEAQDILSGDDIYTGGL